MSASSGILDALRNEERSLKSQLVAIQRAIEAIEGSAGPVVRRGRRKAVKAAGEAQAHDDRGAAPRGGRADAEVLGLAPGGKSRGEPTAGVTLV